MSERPPTTRTDAPAYLQRYLDKKRARESAEVEAPRAYTTHGEPPYMAKVLEHSRARAAAAKAEADAPPGGITHDYAANTTSPREIVPPPSFRDRYAGTAHVRLIRHGQTQGYATDAGLSALGRWQAHRKGQSLARGIKEGSLVRLPYAPTSRAHETSMALREGLLEGLARYGIEADVEDPTPDEHFLNFKVWCEGKEIDVTSAFMTYSTMLETYEAHHGGDMPGWMVEMKRFWEIQSGGGDPITHWLRMPMQYFEPPAICVRRFWRGIEQAVADVPEDTRVFVCTHSGPIRAFATAAVGHDPGEPNNLEDVRIRVFTDEPHAIVTYRERAIDLDIPTSRSVSWSAT